MQACRLRSHTVDVTPPQAATKIMAGMAEQQTEWWNRNDGMADGGTAEWRKGYIPNLPDIFTVHADTDDDDNTLIFYSID